MKEIFDVVNDNDQVTGKATRYEAHSKGLIHRGVVFFIFDTKGRMLINKRSKEKEFYPGCWSIALGGHVNAGENQDDAVVRELKEETGITAKPHYLGSFKKRFDGLDRENNRVYAFVSDDEPILDPHEVVRGEYVEVPELPKILTEREFIVETEVLMGFAEKWVS
ncbi:MAG: NUDIX domain-containing protein [archaeon]